MMTRRSFDAYALGATLYMPVTHQHVPGILRGNVPSPAPSIVLCLEDALAANEVERGVALLDSLLPTVQVELDSRVFVRPRSLEMARILASRLWLSRIDGFVAPKITLDNADGWMDLAKEARVNLMPTLESAEFFDPGKVSAIRDVFAEARDSIAAIRIGGNDLLGAMALRRVRGITSWEGPLCWILSMASSIFISSDLPVAAPVFDVIDDVETLHREAERDVAAGFVSKTAIHPGQVPVIMDAFRVSHEEYEQAEATLDVNAKAVFKRDGMMCEPSTHCGWAARVLARANRIGIQSVDNLSDHGKFSENMSYQ